MNPPPVFHHETDHEAVLQFPAPHRPASKIAMLRNRHAKGFAFAQPLIGRLGEEVFLNESQVKKLMASGLQVDGALLELVVVTKPDGRQSAVEACHLDLSAPHVVAMLWNYVAERRQISEERIAEARDAFKSVAVRAAGKLETAEFATAGLLELQPGLLPLVLAMRDSGFSSADIKPLMARLPALVWIESALDFALPLDHSEPQVKLAVYKHYVRHSPKLAWRMLNNTVYRPPDTPNAEDWDLLWSSLPEERSALGNWVANHCKYTRSVELLLWASRALDRKDAEPELWQAVVNAANNRYLPWLAAWDSWSALNFAPLFVIDGLVRRRYPELMVELDGLTEDCNSSRGEINFVAQEVLDALDERDRALASLWTPKVANEVMQRRHGAQMLSARAAERCAIQYFAKFQQIARDVAVTQLEQSEGDWTLMDLELGGGHGVDVKNCRRTPNGGLLSGRWKVKAFKSDVAGKGVTLMAVSSPFTAHDSQGQLRVKSGSVIGRPSMVVMGVSNASEIFRLMREFEEMSEIHMPRPGRLAELPVWTWDYPAFHYKQRNARLVAIAEALRREQGSPLMQRLIAGLPPALLVLLGVELPTSLVKYLDPQQKDFLDILLRYWRTQSSSKLGKAPVPRLAWLYLFILHFWLRYRLTGRPSDSAAIHALFRPRPIQSGSGEFRTVGAGIGIVDPAATLDRLLEVLAVLDRHLPPQLFVRMTRFMLLSNGVFSAVFPDGQRRTLLAHCGGRLPNLVECGNWPLVYGKELTCGCGRLVCGICQSCTSATGEPCEHEARRKRSFFYSDDGPESSDIGSDPQDRLRFHMYGTRDQRDV